MTDVAAQVDPVVILDKDGRLMLAMRSDGSWEVGPEDAPEAARIFAEHLALLGVDFSPLKSRVEALEAALREIVRGNGELTHAGRIARRALDPEPYADIPGAGQRGC